MNTKGRNEMISVSFVNNTIKPIKVNDSLIDIFNTVRESENSISLLVGDYISSTENNMLNEAVGLDVITEDAMVEKRKGVFDKIGEAIIMVYHKIQAFIEKVIRAFKDLIYRLSPIEKKLDMIKKENPELATKVLAEIDAGNISVMDMKNLAEVDKMYNDILEAAQRKEIDSKTLKGKAEAFKAKFDDLLDENNKTVKKLKATAAIITAATAIIFIKSNFDKAIKADLDAKETSAKWFNTARNVVKQMEKTNHGDALNPDVLTKAQIVSNINNYAQGNFGKIVTQNGKVANVMNSIVTKLLTLTNHDTDAGAFMQGIRELNNLDKTK